MSRLSATTSISKTDSIGHRCSNKTYISKNSSMAAKIAISSSSATFPTIKLLLSQKLSSPCSYLPICSPRSKTNSHFKIHAKLGGEQGEAKQGDKKKFITKEQEPEQYWQSAGEREGENPMKTPLPYIIIFGMSTPFVILAIGFLNGWIKVPIR